MELTNAVEVASLRVVFAASLSCSAVVHPARVDEAVGVRRVDWALRLARSNSCNQEMVRIRYYKDTVSETRSIVN